MSCSSWVIQGKRMMCECCLYPNRGGKPKATDYFPVAQLNLLIKQTLNIPRSSSIKDVKNLRKVKFVQIKHGRRISPQTVHPESNWNPRCCDHVVVCVSENHSTLSTQLLQLSSEQREVENTADISRKASSL